MQTATPATGQRTRQLLPRTRPSQGDPLPPPAKTAASAPAAPPPIALSPISNRRVANPSARRATGNLEILRVPHPSRLGFSKRVGAFELVSRVPAREYARSMSAFSGDRRSCVQ